MSEEKKEMTRDEQVKWFTQQIEMAKLSYDLANYHSLKIQADAKRFEAMAVIARFSAPATKPTEENDLVGNKSTGEGNSKTK